MKGKKSTPRQTAPMKPPDAPAYLNELARGYWKRLTEQLCKRRLLTTDDVEALAILASSYALYEQAQRAIDKEGAVIDGAMGGKIKSPWVTLQNQAWDRIRPLLSEFGLTPCSRAKFGAGDDNEDDEEYFTNPAPRPADAA